MDKSNDAGFNPHVMIINAKYVDVTNFRPGTYRVEVSYYNGTQVTCKL